jgi:hypothetical protein
MGTFGRDAKTASCRVPRSESSIPLRPPRESSDPVGITSASRGGFELAK